MYAWESIYIYNYIVYNVYNIYIVLYYIIFYYILLYYIILYYIYICLIYHIYIYYRTTMDKMQRPHCDVTSVMVSFGETHPSG